MVDNCCCAYFTYEKPDAKRLNDLPNILAGRWRNEGFGLSRPTELMLLFKRKACNEMEKGEKNNRTFKSFNQSVLC